jgi:hypothetical protein
MSKPILEPIPIHDLTLPNPILGDFMRTVLGKGIPFRFRALGSSMHPFIREGDIVIIHPLLKRKPRVGQVAAFIQPVNGLVLVHRLIRRKASDYLIQGDNLPGQDDGWVPRANILGIVVQVKRKERGIWFGQGLTGIGIAWLSRMGMLRPVISLMKKVSGRK